MYVISIWIACAMKHYIDLPQWMMKPMKMTSYSMGVFSLFMFYEAATNRLKDVENIWWATFSFFLLFGVPWLFIVLH